MNDKDIKIIKNTGAMVELSREMRFRFEKIAKKVANNPETLEVHQVLEHTHEIQDLANESRYLALSLADLHKEYQESRKTKPKIVC